MSLILITGGAGFIGSNLAQRLAARADCEVAVCDRLRTAETGKWKNLAGAALADVVAPDELFAWLERRWREVAAVIHMGAVSATTETDVDHILAQNFRLSTRVWDWCVSRQRPLIYASSAAVYGGGEQGFADDNDIAAVARLRPLNPYGWSKQLFDLYALRQAAAGRAPPHWSGLRFFNAYGPNEEHKGAQRSVASQMFARMAKGQPIRLFRSHREGVADGAQARDFVAVQDCVAITEWLLDGEVSGGLLNVGSGAARGFLDLAYAVFEAKGAKAEIEWADTPEPIRATYQYFTQADLSRLRALGYDRPMTSLEDGIAAYAKTWGAGAA